MNPYREAFTHIRSLSSAFWVVISATLMNQIGNMALVFLVLYLNKHLGFNLAQASSAFAVVSGVMLFSGLFGGSLIDKIGAARIMTASLFANGLTLCLFPFIHTYFIILCLCLIWGFFYGLYRPASQTFVSQLSATGMHKITFSLYRLAINLGMSIGPAIGGYLAYHSFAAIFIANGAANILASLILAIGLTRSLWFKYKSEMKQKLELNLKFLKHDPVLRLFVLGMIPICMVFYQHVATLAVFLNRDLHLSLSFYGLLFTINTLIIVFFELTLNVATMNWSYRVNFILGTLFITIGFAGLFFASLRWHVIVLTLCWTLGEMILYPSASSYIADIAPENKKGSYMSLYGTCSNLGLLLGPWGGAIIMSHFGSSGLWLTCGLVGFVSIIIFYNLDETGRKK